MNKSTDEKQTIKLILVGNRMVHMNLLTLHEDGHKHVVRKSAELKLEHQRRLDVTNDLFFELGAIGDPESDIHGILAAATNKSDDMTDSPFDQSDVMLLRHIVQLLEDAERKVHDIQKPSSAVVVSDLLCIKNGKKGSNFVESTWKPENDAKTPVPMGWERLRPNEVGENAKFTGQLQVNRQ